MKSLEDDIKNMKERTSYKEKRRQLAEESKNYRLCDEITEEIGSLSKESRQLSLELKMLTKEKQSKSYYQRSQKASHHLSQLQVEVTLAVLIQILIVM